MSDECQIVTGVEPTSARTRARVARAFGSQFSTLIAVVPVLDDGTDLCRVCEREHEVQLIVAEVLHLLRGPGIRGSTTSASPTRPSPSRSRVSIALIRAP